MLKPSVVFLMALIYYSGLATMLGGAILLPGLTGFAFRSRRGIVGIGWILMALAGWMLGFTVITLVYTALCGGVFGVTSGNRPAYVKVLVAFPFGAIALLLLAVPIQSEVGYLVPFYEKELAGRYICRAYTVPADSTVLTKLVVVRRTDWSLYDEVIAQEKDSDRCAVCRMLDDGRAEIATYYCPDGGPEQRDRVVVSLPNDNSVLSQ